ncbi:MAG TPA: hypothetical protein VGD08_02950 [Stellaceae bacterium]
MPDPSRRAGSATLWLLAESYRDGAECLSRGCLLRHPAPILLLLREAIATALAALRVAPAPPSGGAAELAPAAEALLVMSPGPEPAPLLEVASRLLDAIHDACMDGAAAAPR